MSTLNTNAYAAQPGYQPVAQADFDRPPAQPAPPAYTPASNAGYNPAPPYYPQYPSPAGYAQQQSTNNVVVVQQSAAVIPVIRRPEGYQPDAGQAALVFAMIITILALVFGCWWSIICSIPGMVFASSATSAGLRGDREGVRSNNNLSYGCTIGAIVSGIVILGAGLGLLFGLIYRPRCSYYYSSYYC